MDCASASSASSLHPFRSPEADRRELRPARITVIRYNATEIHEEVQVDPEALPPLVQEGVVTWLNVDGIADVATIQRVGRHLHLHPLVIEDIVNTRQRPKIEHVGEHIYIIAKHLSYDVERQDVLSEQVSIILGSGFVVSFQESPDDLFGQVRNRLHARLGRLRAGGADFLAYSLLDTIVDRYFAILDLMADQIDDLEEAVVGNPSTMTLEQIHDIRRELTYFRNMVWPLREVVSRLARTETHLVAEATNAYLGDVYDHIIQIADSSATYRDIMTGLLDTYLSSISNRTNETMKVLTIVSTLFIPPTLIAGIYGMNFRFMPELNWRWGYPLVWAVIIAMDLVMLWYFRRKRWI